MFFEAVKAGDLSWLKENVILEKSKWDKDEMGNVQIQLILSKLEGADKISSADLRVLYNNINNKALSIQAFGRLATGYLGESEDINFAGSTLKGFKIKWKTDKDND